jgi:hypothetical protein
MARAALLRARPVRRLRELQATAHAAFLLRELQAMAPQVDLGLM